MEYIYQTFYVQFGTEILVEDNKNEIKNKKLIDMVRIGGGIMFTSLSDNYLSC